MGVNCRNFPKLLPRTWAGEARYYRSIPSPTAIPETTPAATAKNKARIASHTAQLLINGYNLESNLIFFYFHFRLVPPKIAPFAFEENPYEIGQYASALCAVSHGDFPLNITWKVNGKAIAGIPGISTNMMGRRSSALAIDSLTQEQSGNFTCRGENSAGYAEHTAILEVNVLPRIASFDFGDTPVHSGQSAQVTCLVSEGDPPLNIRWKFGDRQLTTDDKTIFVNRIGTKASVLLIDKVDETSSGDYTCVARNRAGSVQYTASLFVYVPPRWILEPTDKAFAQGSDAAIECKADGFPKPSVTWKKATGGIPGDYKDFKPNNPDIRVEDGTLMINNIQKNNEGYYLCEAVNGIGSGLSAVVMISVQAPPQFQVKLRNQTSRRGDPAVLQCEAQGERPIGILWNMNNKRLDAQDKSRYTLREQILPTGDKSRYTLREQILPTGVLSDLSINRTERIDSALFTCLATNAFGSDDTSINLIVQEVPEVPYGLKVLDKSGRSVQLSWVAPYDGNSPIVRYQIEYKPSKASWDVMERALVPGPQTEIELKKATTYHIRIVAENDLGTSEPSDTVTIITAEEAPSGVPTNIRVEANDQHSLKVFWQWRPDEYPRRSQRPAFLEGWPPPKTNSSTKQSILTGKRVSGVPTNIRVEANDQHSLKVFWQAPDRSQWNGESGVPTNIRVEANDQHSLKVFWQAPDRSQWNGELLGYYVGYRMASSEDKFFYKTVDFNREEGSEHHLLISDLKTYTQYAVVIQAYNRISSGPLSEAFKAYTAEGVPEQPPHDAICTTLTAQTIRVSWMSPTLDSTNGVIKGYKVISLTAQTIRVSWMSPTLDSTNGVIKGYKVIYGPSDTWFDENTKDAKITPDENTKDAKITPSSETILHGLKKYTNYSMQVLAFTSAGDGVRSQPIHCQTEQDAPEAPVAVKALVMSSDSILVSWKPPAEPNGIIEQYTVYVQEESPDKIKPHKVIPNLRNQNLSFQAKDLDSNLKYQFWVTASTNIGEGQPSKKISVSPSTNVPAKIASFDDTYTTIYKEDMTLPCLAVGIPPPEITWKIKGVAFTTSDRIRQQPDGSLLIRDITRTDAGEYSCHVENSFGQDSVTHQLIVNSPPHSPVVALPSATTDSLTIKLKQPADNEPIHGYSIHYKPEFGSWETVQVPPSTEKYTLANLLCGTRYQVYVTAYNSIGMGDPSPTLNTRTKGDKPIIPSAEKLIEPSSRSVALRLTEWSDGGCPMLYFVVEHKKKTSTEWIQVANNVKLEDLENFVVLDLDPATRYHLRVTAHNNAGFSVGEYEFATLTSTGGTIAPAREIPKEDAIQIILGNLNLVVPAVSVILVIIVAIIVICVLRGKGHYHKDDVVYNQSVNATSTLDKRRPDLRDELGYIVYNQSVNATSTLDKRRPDLRDELGYIAPPNRKLPPVPGSNYNTCDRIKRGTISAHYRSHSTWDPRRHLYEELNSRRGSNETIHTHRGMDDEICPYATFHLLGFREEMDPTKAMQFQTFPHPHAGTMGPSGMNTPHQMHSRAGSQSMPRQNRRYDRVGSQGTYCAMPRQNRQYDTVGPEGNGSIYSPGPEYDDPANCAPEDEQYGSQYGGYNNPYDQYGSRSSIGRRSLGSLRLQPTSNSPEPPPPPPRNHDPSFNDSKDSNEISEAECDRDQLINSHSYGGKCFAGRRSLGSLRLQPTSNSPEPPPPPPRNHDPSFNDSKDSNEISEAECDRDQLINSKDSNEISEAECDRDQLINSHSYGVMRNSAKDGMNHEEMRKLIERNETGQTNGGLTTYDTVAV
ncbi:Immunoglobulin domain [Popillia japonica]|uniref:Immunoglobulin domain n=1 Tax=Popillia japonica TaxID=7064 RepID=A0AAW1HWA2_POPJA